jgi:hypothetical protein
VAAKIAGDLAVAGTISLDDFDATQQDIFETIVARTGMTAEEFVAYEPPKKEYSKGGGGNSSNRGGGRARGNSRGGGRDEDPGSVEFRGGQVAGKTIAEVYALDDVGNGYSGPDYLEWCVQNMNNDFMVKRIEKFLANVA